MERHLHAAAGFAPVGQCLIVIGVAFDHVEIARPDDRRQAGRRIEQHDEGAVIAAILDGRIALAVDGLRRIVGHPPRIGVHLTDDVVALQFAQLRRQPHPGHRMQGLVGRADGAGRRPVIDIDAGDIAAHLAADLVREHLGVVAHSAIRLRAHPVHAVKSAPKVRTLGERRDAKIARFGLVGVFGFARIPGVHSALHDKGVDRVRQAHRLVCGVDPLLRRSRRGRDGAHADSEADRGSGKQQGSKRSVSIHRNPPPLRSGGVRSGLNQSTTICGISQKAGRQAFQGKSAACKPADPSCRFFCLAEFLLRTLAKRRS